MAVVDKEKVRQYMLGLIHANDRDFVRKTVEAFGVSRSTVYNYVKKMCGEGIIQKMSYSECGYLLLYNSGKHYEYQNEGLREDIIFSRDIAPLLEGLDRNVIDIWKYAFTEMMNNAIEHSRSKSIYVNISRSAYDTNLSIIDDGIGIFQNIRDYFWREKQEELTIEECVALLFPGKLTTMRKQHSGEGIFFTSHMMDTFGILSDHVLFTRDSFSDNKLYDNNVYGKGTIVWMSLNNQSHKTSRAVFDRFAGVDGGFTRTHLPIAHIFPGGNPVSRSEARRLAAMIEEFKEITLDYENVEEIGQAFAHELYVVWKDRRSDVVLINENAGEAVLRMIAHVEHSR